MPRLPITKTPKVYVGGAFIRSESGRTFPLRDARGRLIGHVPQCTRKDLRNAVEAAAKAGPGWARRTAYNRGQILYRLAEMIEARTSELSHALAPAGNRAAAREVAASVDRLIHYAGWADKCEQALGSVNAVAGPFFNFTTSEPMGVIGVIAPAERPLLALVSLIAPAIVTGNTVVALASEPHPRNARRVRQPDRRRRRGDAAPCAAGAEQPRQDEWRQGWGQCPVRRRALPRGGARYGASGQPAGANELSSAGAATSTTSKSKSAPPSARHWA
jgi:hypothetical protein